MMTCSGDAFGLPVLVLTNRKIQTPAEYRTRFHLCYHLAFVLCACNRPAVEMIEGLQQAFAHAKCRQQLLVIIAAIPCPFLSI